MQASNSEGHEYVVIERTGVFFVALDLDGNVHMGFDAYREGNIFTLPGGGIEASDRNLFVAGRREVRQEFGRHMRYELLDAIPYVFLCSMDDDTLVSDPYPGQRVKLRIVWFVMETHGNVPRQQRKKEVIDPRAYKVTKADIEVLPMRESSRIALREAFKRGILPKPRYNAHVDPDMASLKQQMIKLLAPPHVYNTHGDKVVRNRKDALMRRLEIADANKHREEQRRLREHRNFEKEVGRILKKGTRRNKTYVQESDEILHALIANLKGNKVA